jgi:hypothetical protein
MKTYQQKQIDKFMSNRKRELNTVKRSFPKFREGMLTVDYVREFQRLNMSGYDRPEFLLRFECDNYFNPAPTLSGPEVTIEESLL